MVIIIEFLRNWLNAGVGNDFFPGGGVQGGIGSSSSGGVSGGFWEPKIDQIRAKFENMPILGLNYTKLA